jgi:hypothetical protein
VESAFCKKQPKSADTQLSKNNERDKGKNWSRVPVPGGCLTPRRTGRLTVGRNITLTLTCLLSCLFHCKSTVLRSGAQYESEMFGIQVTNPFMKCTELSTRNIKTIMFLENKVRPVRRADYLTAIHEPSRTKATELVG